MASSLGLMLGYFLGDRKEICSIDPAPPITTLWEPTKAPESDQNFHNSSGRMMSPHNFCLGFLASMSHSVQSFLQGLPFQTLLPQDPTSKWLWPGLGITGPGFKVSVLPYCVTWSPSL